MAYLFRCYLVDIDLGGVEIGIKTATATLG